MTIIKQIFSLSLGLTIATVITACGSGTEEQQASEDTKTVTVLGVVVGEQQDKLEAALAPFEEKTGITIVYEGTDAFATLLPVRVESGDAPDVAMFAQPGLMRDFAQSGQLVPISGFMEQSKLEEAYSQDWIDLAKVDDELYGVWYRAYVKSLVWYNPQAFAAQGYEVPQTWSEMITLSDRIVADGQTPWCLGMESGDATGWVGTDWVEDIMLRTAGAEVYDRWVNHEIPFDAPPVKEAFDKFGEIVLNPEYVQGGIVGAISTPFGDSPRGLLREPPNCYLHRQSSITSSFLPAEAVLGENIAVFPLPGIKEEFGTPVLVGGDVFAMFNDTPEARALMEYLATPEPHEIWAKLGGFISPHQQVSLDVYPDEVSKEQAEILANAETIRYDGSDMMPSSVGTGTFWTGIIDFVGGEDAEEVLTEIEKSWTF
ncbi:Alpha-glucosides-binding periplasmic protein AglE [Hyella patelloides LEGE 07179]|uniref:Alpha-glucosides-binding periplasmic protein AglE n=1 Tax=Hyella patelloides LEGE 07179 TaxID=945734 RepID=A0A563VMM6_9CYAN|nr:ABC transporter substrate-binding protein [Hyella patelloides]VEP12617.1 Alpha-glucosides-binding periplasmic protein AglE [Hyella patelloides LEGE 07179]